MPGNSAGDADGESMINEEKEHVGNLPVNVFPISAEGGRQRAAGRRDKTILHVLTIKDVPLKRTELMIGLMYRYC